MQQGKIKKSLPYVKRPKNLGDGLCDLYQRLYFDWHWRLAKDDPDADFVEDHIKLLEYIMHLVAAQPKKLIKEIEDSVEIAIDAATNQRAAK